jgi:hypothetical protein
VQNTTVGKKINVDKNFHEEAYVAFTLANRDYVIGDFEKVSRAVHKNFFKLDDPVLSSRRRKFLIFFRMEFYHTVLDTLTTILRVNEQNPGTLFVIYVDSRYIDNYTLFEYVLRVLTHNNIDHLVIRSPIEAGGDGPPNYAISFMRNFSFLSEFKHNPGDEYEPSISDVKFAFDKILELASPAALEAGPHKKIYLSRAKVPYFELDPAEEYAGYRHDNRIENEQEVENYLKSKGYEIVYPEDFTSFQDQVDLLVQTKAMVAPTGSGMINIGLMRDNQTVIELRCELLYGNPVAGTHPAYQHLIDIYSNIAYIKGHSHIQVANVNKKADVAIEKLENLFVLFGPPRI